MDETTPDPDALFSTPSGKAGDERFLRNRFLSRVFDRKIILFFCTLLTKELKCIIINIKLYVTYMVNDSILIRNCHENPSGRRCGVTEI